MSPLSSVLLSSAMLSNPREARLRAARDHAFAMGVPIHRIGPFLFPRPASKCPPIRSRRCNDVDPRSDPDHQDLFPPDVMSGGASRGFELKSIRPPKRQPSSGDPTRSSALTASAGDTPTACSRGHTSTTGGRESHRGRLPVPLPRQQRLRWL